MSISVNVISVTKNISINTAELGVARSPITVTDSNKLLIINNVLTQDIVAKKSTNIPVGVDYFNYSSVNDEGLSGDITIKSEASISFGGGPAPTLYPFTDATFTNGDATGRFGPTLTQARNGVSGPEVNEWKNNTEFFNTTDGIQLWTVPLNGTYRIEAWGSEGGGPASGFIGGRGARMRGDFQLTAGEVIRILVGQRQTATSSWGHGGGGGTFVVRDPYNTNQSILVIAGGGGGASPSRSSSGLNAVLTETGGSSTGGQSGGTNGSGGAANRNGGGGGGFSGNGANGSSGGFGGQSFIDGGAGGVSNISSDDLDYRVGGFGGGGGGTSSTPDGGGGGGGFSGGGGGHNPSASTDMGGGGGGSFNSGTNQSNSADVRTGNGQVTITLIENTTPPPTLGLSGPETATFGDTLTYQFLYSPDILPNGTDLAYTITGIDSDSIVGNTLSGTIKVYDDASFLIIKLENIGITGTLTLTITLPDNSTETFSTEIVSSFINVTTVTPTVISTTFNDAQPESAPMLSQLFSKKIMIGPDTLAYSLTRVITTTKGINVVKDQELGLFVDGNGRAIVAVLNNDNDPRIVLEPSVSVVAGPVQQWF